MLLLLIVLVLVLGNSATSTKLATPRNIALQGAVNGNANFDGSGNITITTTQANIAVLTGTITLSEGSGSIDVTYPSGYTKDNCIAIAMGMDIFNNTISFYSASSSHIFEVRLKSTNISVRCTSLDGVGTSTTKNYKVVLMKVS